MIGHFKSRTLRMVLFCTIFFNSASALGSWTIGFPQTTQPIKDWMKRFGFSEEKGSAAAWKIEGGSLVMVQNRDSTTIGSSRGFPLSTASSPWLHFEVQVDELPTLGDLAKQKKEDAAFRIFILFDKGGGLVTPPNTLGYAWASQTNAPDVVSSERFPNVKFISFAKGQTDIKKWMKFSRNVADDYKKVFSSNEVPKIKGIALKSDGNDTAGNCKAMLRLLEFSDKPN